ncbi:MAG: response regulator transcription factor [Bacteroidota bacterium]
MIRRALSYGLLLSALLAGLKLVQYYFFSYRIDLEFYMSIIAALFLGMGLWVGYHVFSSRSKEAPEHLELGVGDNDVLSDREMEVLLEIAKGQTNQEIADSLFVSLNTVKTHVSNIYVKLNVSRRTQALAKAKSLNLLSENV